MPKEHQEFEYDQIDDHIWIGTNQCCQTHFEESLLKKEIRADISLEKEHLDAPYGVGSFLWLPTEDHTSPSLAQLHLGAEHLRLLVQHDMKVYVHCKNGHGRAPTLVAAYYILTGMSVDEAIKFVCSKRRGAHVDDVQRRGLEEFTKSLK
ncbi:dual specificity protein phosphatase family protein [Patescibacteria group bacterium]|nr:dual specificity protein phosphatase family protein [Patescibacteria group bacterium]